MWVDKWRKGLGSIVLLKMKANKNPLRIMLNTIQYNWSEKNTPAKILPMNFTSWSMYISRSSIKQVYAKGQFFPSLPFISCFAPLSFLMSTV